jgi:hypothetical protein
MPVAERSAAGIFLLFERLGIIGPEFEPDGVLDYDQCVIHRDTQPLDHGLRQDDPDRIADGNDLGAQHGAYRYCTRVRYDRQHCPKWIRLFRRGNDVLAEPGGDYLFLQCA